MNRAAIQARVNDRCIKLTTWCKKFGVSYVCAHALIYRDTKKLETRMQMAVIDALKTDGLYIPSDDEAVAP